MLEILRRKYLISFAYLIICLAGWFAWMNIPLENAPELNLPSITVGYTWGSASPEVAEQEITRKVESSVSRLRDVVSIESVTTTGRSSVTARFAKNTPVDHRILELREFLTALEEELPQSVTRANISRQVPRELQEQQTFMVYTLSGEYSGKDLLEYTRRSIKPKMMGLDGLADVALQGVLDPALTVEFDAELIERYNLNSSLIMNQIRDQLSWRSSGFIDAGSDRTGLIIPPQFTGISDIEALKIQIPGSLRTIELREIAEVKVTDYPANSIRRVNGNPSLSLEFVKEGGADAIGLARKIRSAMDEIRQSLPSGMQMRLQIDSTEKLTRQFDELKFQAILSGLLVFFVVTIFIRKIRAPLVIIGSVFFSLFISVGLLMLIDYTLNVITLAGLTISLGMLIDNAVVVFEQINPNLPTERTARLQHVKTQLPKATVPVLGSTFTTVGIFMPLLFAMEDLRIFLLPLAVALTFTLLSSVLVAFTWIPYALIWLTPASLKQKRKEKKNRKWRWALLIMVWKSRLRWVFAVGVIAVIGIPTFAITEPKWDEETWWPEFSKVYFENRKDIDKWIGGLTYKFSKETYFGSPWRGRSQEVVSVSVRPPQGTPLSELNKIISNFETIAKPYEHAFEYYEANISEYTGGSIRFVVKPEYLFKNKNNDPIYFFGEAMYLGARTGNVVTTVSGFGEGNTFGFGGSTSGYVITLRGFAYQELIDLAKNLEERLKKSRRVSEVDINHSYYSNSANLFQYLLELDEEEIIMRGLGKREVLSSLSMDLNPVNNFGRVEFQGKEMFLIGRNKELRKYQEDLMSKGRQFGDIRFDVSQIAKVDKERILSDIRRTNQSYSRQVAVKYLGTYKMGNDYIKSVLEEVPVPVGTSIQYGSGFFTFGQTDKQKNLLLVAFLSILCVWMIVAALLESFLDPGFVILAIPFSAVGVMSGSLYNDLAFDSGAIAGALLCIGVVVNNAILLIHAKKLQYNQGIKGLRCWFYVFKSKMRPILITSITTISGLIPMILYGSDEFWESLAIVVAWGLSMSTVLLLLISGAWAKRRI